MSCAICKRSNCIPSFHSFEEQERHEYMERWREHFEAEEREEHEAELAAQRQSTETEGSNG